MWFLLPMPNYIYYYIHTVTTQPIQQTIIHQPNNNTKNKNLIKLCGILLWVEKNMRDTRMGVIILMGRFIFFFIFVVVLFLLLLDCAI